MAAGLALVEIIALLAHVNAWTARVLALHFITRLAWLAIVKVVARWARARLLTLTTWRAAITEVTACAVTRVLPWLSGIGCARAAAVVAAAVITTAAFGRGAAPATSRPCAGSIASSSTTAATA